MTPYQRARYFEKLRDYTEKNTNSAIAQNVTIDGKSTKEYFGKTRKENSEKEEA